MLLFSFIYQFSEKLVDTKATSKDKQWGCVCVYNYVIMNTWVFIIVLFFNLL